MDEAVGSVQNTEQTQTDEARGLKKRRTEARRRLETETNTRNRVESGRGRHRRMETDVTMERYGRMETRADKSEMERYRAMETELNRTQTYRRMDAEEGKLETGKYKGVNRTDLGRCGRMETQVDKTEPEEDLPDVFTFHVALTNSTTYYRWRDIGAAQQLATDEDIACFLMECYDKGRKDSPSGSATCTKCQASLKLLCAQCDAESFRLPASVPGPPATDADSNAERVKPKVEHAQRDDRPPITSTKAVVSLPHVSRKKRGRKKKPEKLRSSRRRNNNNNTSITAEQHTDRQEKTRSSGRDKKLPSSPKRQLRTEVESEETKEEEPASPLLPAETPLPKKKRTRRHFPGFISCECQVCGRKLCSKQSLVRHVVSRHSVENLPAVLRDYGNKVAELLKNKRSSVTRNGEAGTVRRRKRALPIAPESLVCEMCGKEFDKRRRFTEHRAQCTLKVCEHCGESVKNLAMHMKRHFAPRPYRCPYCTNTYLVRYKLETHVRCHTGEKPFCCEVCGARFRERSILNVHMRTHTGVKPFKCDQCDACFTRKRGLSDHMRVHTGEKPYGCQVCGRQFSSTGNLAAHRRKVHRLGPQIARPAKKSIYMPNSDNTDYKDFQPVAISSTPLPVGVTPAQQMMGGISAPQQTMGGVNIPHHAVGGVSTPQQMIGGVSAPQQAMAGVGTPQQAVGVINTPQQAVGVVSASQQAVGVVNTPQQAVGVVNTPQQAVGGGVNAPPQAMNGISGPQQNLGLSGSQQNLGVSGPQQNLGVSGPQQNLGVSGPQQNLGVSGPQQNLGVSIPQQVIGGVCSPQQTMGGGVSSGPPHTMGSVSIVQQTMGISVSQQPISMNMATPQTLDLHGT